MNSFPSWGKPDSFLGKYLFSFSIIDFPELIADKQEEAMASANIRTFANKPNGDCIQTFRNRTSSASHQGLPLTLGFRLSSHPVSIRRRAHWWTLRPIKRSGSSG